MDRFKLNLISDPDIEAVIRLFVEKKRFSNRPRRRNGT